MAHKTISKKCRRCGEVGPHRFNGRYSKRTGSPQFKSHCNKCDNKKHAEWQKSPNGKKSLHLSREKRKLSETGKKAKDRYARKVSLHCNYLKKLAINYLGGPKCKYCGLEDNCLAIYDFHHRDSASKKIGISTWIRKQALGITVIDGILTELDKCTVTCSNCHKKQHYCCKRT